MTGTVRKSLLGSTLIALLLAMACGPATREMPAPAPTPTPAPPPPPPPPPPPVVEAPKAEEHHAPHWTYAGETSAPHWGDLSAEWATCKSGTAQSPIDIVSKSATADAALKPVEFSYGKLPLSIFNNGHTVQVPNSTDNGIKVSGQTSKLVQFHLHTPSEHWIDGKPADMELHLVHKNEQGALTVVGLLFKKGKENKALAQVFANAPAEVTEEAKPVEKAELDLAKILPTKRGYYSYAGSLTTPPCTEGVSWIVMQSVGEVSEAQIAKFREVTHGDTVRPVQPLNARAVNKTK